MPSSPPDDTALAEPGDVIMSISQPFGGHSSNRIDGPAGVRGPTS